MQMKSGIDQLQHMPRLLLDATKAWFNHRASSKGAALSFYTLFSLTPILVLAIAFVGYFFGQEAAQVEIIHQIESLVGSQGAEATKVMLAAARNDESSLWATLVAAILLIIGATTVFAELKASLDEIWGIETNDESALKSLLMTRLLSFSIVLALAFLLLTSLVVNAGLAMLERYVGGLWGEMFGMFTYLSTLVTFGVIACMFALIYKMLPEVPLSWSDVWIGAAVTAGLFIFGKYAIGLYLGNSDIASGYGAAGSLVALMLWVYYSAQIFFLGAEFTRQYATRLGSLQNLARKP
ncbi:MAG TPA: YihY/virulence factor BrkB family protein [Methylophilaceae bacterium]|jgi:membrane protein|nr:YihY/virulence factor BrkB family protein [Methylophilaceae bacterium]